MAFSGVKDMIMSKTANNGCDFIAVISGEVVAFVSDMFLWDHIAL